MTEVASRALSLPEATVAAYLRHYHQRRAANASGLPLRTWEANFLVAEIYAALLSISHTRHARHFCRREIEDLTIGAGRGLPEAIYVNALAYVWSRPGPLIARASVPPFAIGIAIEEGATELALHTDIGRFWRVRVLPAAVRFAEDGQRRAVDFELAWWMRRLLVPPTNNGDKPRFGALATRAILQAELAVWTSDERLAAAAAAALAQLADESRYSRADVGSADLARALYAASLVGEAELVQTWLDELLGSRLDERRTLLFREATGVRYDLNPWIPRALVAAAPSMVRLIDAMSRPGP